MINLAIADFNTRRVLVDNRSSANILYYSTFQQMRIGREQLMPSNIPLVGFGGMKVMPIGSIALPITIDTYPQQITKVTFLLVDCSLAYNVIIGRPTLNTWRVITSIYHLLLKFPMEFGIGKAYKDQMAAWERYVTML